MKKWSLITAVFFACIISLSADPLKMFNDSATSDLKASLIKDTEFRIDWSFNGTHEDDYFNTSINSSLLSWSVVPKDSGFYHSVTYCADLLAVGAFITGIGIDYIINDSHETARRLFYITIAPLIITNSRISVSPSKMPWFDIYTGTTGDLYNWSEGDLTPKISGLQFEYVAVAGLNIAMKSLLINAYIQKPIINPIGLPNTSFGISIGLRTLPPSV